MTQQTEFRVGDKVEHVNGARGRVTAIKDGGTVCVSFSNDRGYWKGEYDNLWFELHPGWLVRGDGELIEERKR